MPPSGPSARLVRPMEGILFIDKPGDRTSHDVIDDIRRSSKIRRVGHAGTLDPIATGLLIVAVGRACRALEFFEALDKEYELRARLGRDTDTHDRTGKTTREAAFDHVSPEKIDEVLPRFVGKIEQKVPAYSAVRIKGKKLYERVRAGETVEPPTRTVEVHRLERRAYDPPWLDLRVACSKGCYVRALVRDIAAALETCGSVEEVRRTRVGPLRVEDAVPLSDLADEEAVRRRLLPVDRALSFLPEMRLGEEHQGRFLHGQVLDVRPVGKLMRVYGPRGFLGIGASSWDRYIKPRKIFP